MTDPILSNLRRIAQTYPTAGVQDAVIAAITEIERLRAGGCARGQRTTQWCAEADALRHDIARHVAIAAEQAGEIERLRALLLEARHVIVGAVKSPR